MLNYVKSVAILAQDWLDRASGTKVVEDFPPQRPPRYTPTFLGTVANFLTSSDRRPLSKLALHVLGPSH